MKVLIRPKKLSGTINVVPSKSYSHRAIIAASLADGESIISNVLYSEDIKRTIECCSSFGAKIKCYDDYLVIQGVKRVERIENIVDAGESGSTIRFMIPIMLTNGEEITFTGRNHLNHRPLDLYFDIFDKQGITYHKPINAYMPLKVNGKLSSGLYEVRGDVSSQFITGLLYALPLLDGDSVIKITTELESKSYVDLTLDILAKFGIEIINNNYLEFIVKGNQKYTPSNYQIEGDYSQAAFFLVMGALGNDISLRCMNEDSLQGDKKILLDITSFGGNITFDSEILKATAISLTGTTIDFSNSPDLGPVLSVLASLSSGNTTFINAARLRIKECDRITCMKEELLKLGANVSETVDTMSFVGVDSLTGSLDLYSHNDHRIAMSLAVASTVCTSDIMITGAECVKKSYPHFWSDFKKLGGDFDEFE